MDQYNDNLKALDEKLAAETRAEQGQSIPLGYNAKQEGLRRSYSPLRDAEDRIGYHREQTDKAVRAAMFFRENHAFEQFVMLVREGVIQL